MIDILRERGAAADTDRLSNEEIREVALANGFKLKVQKGGGMDLNPYVYTFVRAIIIKARAKAKV